MKANQFKFRQGTGVATVIKAETEEEIVIIEVLQDLIENESGALSRKCFTFDNGEMTIDIDKYAPVSNRKPVQKKKQAKLTEVAVTK